MINQIFTTIFVGLTFEPPVQAAKPGCDASEFDQLDHADVGFGADGYEAHQQQARPNIQAARIKPYSAPMNGVNLKTLCFIGGQKVSRDEYEFYGVIFIVVFCAAIIIIVYAFWLVVKENIDRLRNDIAALRLQFSFEPGEYGTADSRRLPRQRIRALNVAEKVEAQGDALYVWAWCDRDQALRQFRVARMSTLVDAETGTISEAVDLAMWFAERGAHDADIKE